MGGRICGKTKDRIKVRDEMLKGMAVSGKK
jgi:hypothetical protein